MFNNVYVTYAIVLSCLTFVFSSFPIGDHFANKKRRLSAELPYLKTMIETLTLKLMKYQTESDARILSKIEELENERTAMDERMQKMWIDFEEKRRSEEREHELNIMKIFQDIMSQLNVNNVAKE